MLLLSSYLKLIVTFSSRGIQRSQAGQRVTVQTCVASGRWEESTAILWSSRSSQADQCQNEQRDLQTETHSRGGGATAHGTHVAHQASELPVDSKKIKITGADTHTHTGEKGAGSKEYARWTSSTASGVDVEVEESSLSSAGASKPEEKDCRCWNRWFSLHLGSLTRPGGRRAASPRSLLAEAHLTASTNENHNQNHPALQRVSPSLEVEGKDKKKSDGLICAAGFFVWESPLNPKNGFPNILSRGANSATTGAVSGELGDIHPLKRCFYFILLMQLAADPKGQT